MARFPRRPGKSKFTAPLILEPWPSPGQSGADRRLTFPIGNTEFGDLLVRATVTGQLGGEISREWKPEGLVIQLSVPRERLTG
jgi:hypothetical protein